MMLLTDIQEGHELLLDLLQLGRILLIGILQMLERTPWIDIVAWVDTHLLAVKGCHIGRMGREMYIGHKRCRIAVGLQLGRDILHILGLTNALGSKAYKLATGIDDTLGLSHTALGIIRIYRSHRLDTDRIMSTNADIADTGFSGLSSLIHLSWS